MLLDVLKFCVFAGGSLVSLEFLNSYFFYAIEPLTSTIMGAKVTMLKHIYKQNSLIQ